MLKWKLVFITEKPPLQGEETEYVCILYTHIYTVKIKNLSFFPLQLLQLCFTQLGSSVNLQVLLRGKIIKAIT